LKRKHVSPPKAAPPPEPLAPQSTSETETEALVIEAVAKAVKITSSDAIAIQRLRNSLIEKLFTPDRSFQSWTELKANN
jgi:hypothetical protein